MSKLKSSIVLLTLICVVATGISVYFFGGIERENLEIWLQSMGLWASIIYIVLYTIGTLLILPSTPLNLTGGALFGTVWGTVWTTIASMIAAIIAFAFTRSVGREFISKKMAGNWEAVDAEIRQSGIFYIFAVRLLPIIPYGLTSYTAGLTSISYKDYLIGTVMGVVPGVLPFVMIGSGLQALSRGDILPLMFALALAGMLIGGATWYRRRRQNPQKALQEIERKKY